jgi:hypothetical protein
MIEISVPFTPDYRDEKTFVASMIGRVKIQARERGWTGLHLVEAAYAADPDNLDRRRLTLRVGPGHGDITVKDIGDACRAARRRQAT